MAKKKSEVEDDLPTAYEKLKQAVLAEREAELAYYRVPVYLDVPESLGNAQRALNFWREKQFETNKLIKKK